MNYPNVAENALLEGPPFFRKFAPYIGHVVNTFLLIYQLGCCCVYVVFVASNIKSIADFYLNEPVDVRLCMVIILLPLIFINWVSIGQIYLYKFNWFLLSLLTHRFVI